MHSGQTSIQFSILFSIAQANNQHSYWREIYPSDMHKPCRSDELLTHLQLTSQEHSNKTLLNWIAFIKKALTRLHRLLHLPPINVWEKNHFKWLVEVKNPPVESEKPRDIFQTCCVHKMVDCCSFCFVSCVLCVIIMLSSVSRFFVSVPISLHPPNWHVPLIGVFFVLKIGS